MAATNSAVVSAVDTGWLTEDTTAAQASGKAPQGVLGGEIAAPIVPETANPIQPDTYELAPSEGAQYDTEHAGAWPDFPELGSGKGPVETPVHGGAGGSYEESRPDASINPLSPANPGGGNWVSDVAHPGFNAQSQATDNAGWKQNTPTGRIADRRTFGHANPLDSEWFQYDGAQRAVAKRYALVGVPNTDQPGTGEYPTPDGSLPDYGAAMGPQGNLAYEAPAAPATTSVDQVPAMSGAADWQWGNF